MRLYKKSNKIMTCKIDNKVKIIACSKDIDLIKDDIKLFHDLIVPEIENVLIDNDYAIIIGLGYNTKIIGINDINKFIETCRIKPLLGGFLSDDNINLIRYIA